MKTKSSTLLVIATILLVGAAGLPAQDETPPQILFKDVRVFDGTSEQLTARTQVLVESNLIKAIGPSLQAAAGATVVDGGGRTLMPGLIDSHTHFNFTGGLASTYGGLQSAKWSQIAIQAAANAKDHLLDGFTTIRDMCGMDNGLQEMVDRGVVVGPRIYPSAACISPSSGHGDARDPGSRTPGAPPTQLERLGMIEIADSPDEVRAASRRNLSNGAAFLKVMAGGGVTSQLDPLYTHAYTQAELEAAVEAAAFFDTYVTVHAYTDTTVGAALDAGVKCIDHGQMVTEETVRRMVEEGIFWSVNLAGQDPSLRTHPTFSHGAMREKLDFYLDASKHVVDLIKRFKPKVVFNVDTVLSTMEVARAQRDFELYTVSRHFGNHAALVSMTSTAGELAALTGQRNPYPEAKLGVVEEGAYADVLVVDGNPLEDLSVIGAHDKWLDAQPREAGRETIRVIMKDGKIYKNTLE